MEIFYLNNHIQKQCENPQKYYRGNFELIKWIETRMVQLKVAPTLLSIKNIKNAHLHCLIWDRKCELAIDALLWWKKRQRRIIFQPHNWENIFEDFKNDIKINTVTEIIILEINEKHYQ